MFFKSNRLIERQEGIDELNELVRDKNNTLIIHYSCESFVTNHGNTPRITSISIRNLKTAQTKSFSIHLQAQFNKLTLQSLKNDDYDKLERELLDEYFSFLGRHKTHRWAHWNMRDTNYGFEAINNRYRILGGTPIEIDDDRKYDLPRIIGKIYSYRYEKNRPKGRLLNLADRNNITTLEALTGKDEADAFENHKYLELHRSTLRKVDIIETIIYKIINRELKVNSSSKEIYGLSISGLYEITKNNWILFIVWSIIIFIIGAAFEPIIQKLFGTSN